MQDGEWAGHPLQRARNALADVGRNVIAGALVEAMKYGIPRPRVLY